MMRVELEIEENNCILLFKVYPTGLEFGFRGKTYLLEFDSSTLKNIIDNLHQCSRIRIV